MGKVMLDDVAGFRLGGSRICHCCATDEDTMCVVHEDDVITKNWPANL